MGGRSTRSQRPFGRHRRDLHDLGGIASGLVFADFPHVVAIDALKESVGDGVAGAPGLKASQIIFYNDHAVELILVSLALAIGSAAMAPILGFMYRATAARTPKLPRMALYSAMIGPILVAVGTIALQVATSVKASDFAGAADQSTAAAHDALTGGVLLGATLLRQLGVLVVGLAFVLISLHAMRVGLLTKFLGSRHHRRRPLRGAARRAVAGRAVLLPLTLGFRSYAAGRRDPAAWDRRGRAVATQQEVREQRARDAAESRGEDPDAAVAAMPVRRGRRGAPAPPAPLPRPGASAAATEAVADEATEPSGTPHSSSKKKKRKRR